MIPFSFTLEISRKAVDVDFEDVSKVAHWHG
jgi:hypothetical protein